MSPRVGFIPHANAEGILPSTVARTKKTVAMWTRNLRNGVVHENSELADLAQLL
jgi:hypothetical protein